MERSRVAIVIPALNEENSIGDVVRNCIAYGLPIVVDDGSADQTGEIAKREGADVVRHLINKGYDAALNSGFARAAERDCEFVITLDADGQHNPALVEQYITQLKNGADIVLGIRNKHQRVAEFFFSCTTRFLYGIQDPLCGLKGYRMSLYKALGHFDSYGSIGTELALFAVRKHYHIYQLPITIRNRRDLPRFGRRLRANYKILRALALSLVKTSA